MTPREGAFVGGIIGVAAGGLAGLAAKRMIRGNTDLKALTFTGVTLMSTYVGAIIGAGVCPPCTNTCPPCPQTTCPPCPQQTCPPCPQCPPPYPNVPQ